MANTFLISDTHFGHANILKYVDIRRVFETIEEHDEFLIQKWNEVVRPGDKVYHLGDVGFFNVTQFNAIFERLNGSKILIKGNHDILKLSQYAQQFKDIRGSHSMDGLIMTHIPIHPYSLDRWRGNVHGHLHDSTIPNDKRYLCVSCEHIGMQPIPFESVRAYYKELNK